MKFRACIGIHTKSVFWFISHINLTLILMHMMRIPKFWLNIIFTFWMITSMILNCFGLHWRYILDGLSPRWHYVWSNGCANQFKSSKPLYFVSRYPNMTSGCKMMWSFFKNGHGKGPHDGVGVIIKWFIWHKQLNAHGTKLQNVENVNFLHANLFDHPKSL